MLVMENSEEVMQILERFTKLKQKEIPKELEEYLCYVAKTGDTVYRWANVKYLFREKLVHVIKDFHDTTPSVDDLPQYPNVDPFNYETMKSSLLERLDMFGAAPFTIQRLSELLTEPRKQYSRIDKFMRALEKNILVVSTIEPGRKQAESENGDSLDSVVNGDLSLDVNVDIDMDGESIFSVETQNTTATISFIKNEEDSASLPKKPKLDVILDNDVKTKSDSSESDEASDDSDSSDSKEISKEEEVSNKSEENEVITSQVKDKSDETKESDEKKINDENKESELSVKTTINSDDYDDSDTKEKSSFEDKDSSENCSSNVNDNDLVKINPDSSTPTKIENTEENIDNTEKVDQSVEKNKTDEIVSEKDDNIEDEKTVKSDTTEICSKEAKEQETEIDIDIYQPIKVTSIPQNLNTESSLKSEESVEKLSNDNITSINSSNEIILKKDLNDTSNFSACTETTTSSEVIQKIQEEMSVEDTSHSVLLPQLALQQENISILSGNEINTTENIDTQQNSDQPMDENIDTGITISTIVGNVGETGSIDEIMQSDEKVDLSGMDVDDTSQEEAMDQ